MSGSDSSSEDGDEAGLLGKLVLTGVVLFIAPFTELGTGPAPIGTLGALVSLALIWGFDDEAETLAEAE